MIFDRTIKDYANVDQINDMSYRLVRTKLLDNSVSASNASSWQAYKESEISDCLARPLDFVSKISDKFHDELRHDSAQVYRIKEFKFHQYRPDEDTPTNVSPATTNRWSSLKEANEFSNSHQLQDEVSGGKIHLVSGISNQLMKLERKFARIDQEIARLKNICGDSENLMSKILELVHEKSSLLRRQMQLIILKQENALESEYERLSKELRYLMSVDDSNKTTAQLERQRHLYEWSLALVRERDKLLNYLDIYERGMEDDRKAMETARQNISTRERPSNGCCIQ